MHSDPQLLSKKTRPILSLRRSISALSKSLVSQPLKFRVQRQAGGEFVAPTVREADQNTLDPIKAFNGATVRIAYASMQITDTIFVSWAVGNSAPIETAEKNGQENGIVEFTVPFHIVAASAGKSVNVTYVVQRNETRHTSQALDLDVKTLPGYYLEDFEALPIGEEEIYELSGLTIQRISGKLGVAPHSNFPYTINHTVWFDTAITIRLHQDAEVVSFGHAGDASADTDVYCYDREGELITYHHVPNSPGFLTLFSSQKNIHYVKFLSSRTLHLDNFSYF